MKSNLILSHRKFLILISLLLCCILLNGQNISDTISIAGKNTIKFYQYIKEVRVGDISRILKSNQEASDYFRYSQINRTFSNIFLGAGIVTFGYGVVSGISYAIDDEESSQLLDRAMAGLILGGALIAIYFPLKRAYKKNARTAIDIYNKGLGLSGQWSPGLNIGVTKYGLGVVLHF